MSFSKDYIDNTITNKYVLFMMISIIMVLFISLIKIIRVLFGNDYKSCSAQNIEANPVNTNEIV